MAGADSHGVLRRKLQSSLKMTDDKYEGCTSYIKHFVSEFIGTGLLVFIGCMGIFANHKGANGDLTGICLYFGMAAFIAIQITAPISGGHINPAVTISGLIFKNITIPMALVHILAQCLGSIFFFGVLQAITTNEMLGEGSGKAACSNQGAKGLEPWQVLLAEFLLTGVLQLVVCSAWDPRNKHHDSLTFKFGITISALAYAGVNYSGCGMNPARSLGPAVWENIWRDHWVYWVGPILGAVFVSIVYRIFFWPPPEPAATLPRGTKVELETINTIS